MGIRNVRGERIVSAIEAIKRMKRLGGIVSKAFSFSEGRRMVYSFQFVLPGGQIGTVASGETEAIALINLYYDVRDWAWEEVEQIERGWGA